MGDGKNSLFWKDCWLNGKSLANNFLELYNICNDKFVSIHEAHEKKLRLEFHEKF